jgi:hypothetical protein
MAMPEGILGNYSGATAGGPVSSSPHALVKRTLIEVAQLVRIARDEWDYDRNHQKEGSKF